MGRPARADAAAKRMTCFRLTEAEEARLDALVIEQGHKDRSALLRSWLEQAGPARVSSAEPQKASLLEQVIETIQREQDPRLGLVHVPRVVRELQTSFSIKEIHAALFTLHEQGALELRPEAGSEFISPKDAALCPPGPRGTIFSFARWTSSASGSANPTQDNALILSKLRELESREPPGSLLSVRTLRGLCALSKTRFDAGVLRLSAQKLVVLHHHDFPGGLSDDERALLVSDAHGTHYVGIAIKKGAFR